MPAFATISRIQSIKVFSVSLNLIIDLKTERERKDCDVFPLSQLSPRQGAGQDLDANEIIDVELVPVDELLGGMRDHEFDHAMMHVALGLYLRAADA